MHDWSQLQGDVCRLQISCSLVHSHVTVSIPIFLTERQITQYLILVDGYQRFAGLAMLPPVLDLVVSWAISNAEATSARSGVDAKTHSADKIGAFWLKKFHCWFLLQFLESLFLDWEQSVHSISEAVSLHRLNSIQQDLRVLLKDLTSKTNVQIIQSLV